MEDACKYVNSIGILKSCTINNKWIESSSSYIDPGLLTGVKENDSIYLCSTAIKDFIVTYLQNLSTPIILVTGNSDDIIANPSIYQPLLESPYIIKWFAQNCIIQHPKIVNIPIGTYYHVYYDGNPKNQWASIFKSPLEQEADIIELLKTSRPFWERTAKCYSTFHFQLGRGDRAEAYRSIPKDLIDYEPTQVSRIVSHTHQMNYAFVASPYGGGIDCHRTWEALVLGCIPIVTSNSMNPLFDDLPVLIINNWSDITEELLQSTMKEFKNKTFNYEKLTLQYWTTLINAPVKEISKKN
jgi:hypothetical protein